MAQRIPKVLVHDGLEGAVVCDHKDGVYTLTLCDDDVPPKVPKGYGPTSWRAVRVLVATHSESEEIGPYLDDDDE